MNLEAVRFINSWKEKNDVNVSVINPSLVLYLCSRDSSLEMKWG
jgi:hypothetical protein